MKDFPPFSKKQFKKELELRDVSEFTYMIRRKIDRTRRGIQI